MTTPATSRADLQAQADETLAAFGRGVLDIRHRSDRARAAIESATAHTSSPDGTVTVDVTLDGQLRAISLRPDATTAGSSALAATIMATVRAGTAQALNRAKDGVSAALGADNAAVDVLDRKLAEVARSTEAPLGRDL